MLLRRQGRAKGNKHEGRHTRIGMAKTGNTDNTTCWRGWGTAPTLRLCGGWGCKMAPPRWKTSLVASQRTKHTLNRPINAWAPGVYKGAERSCPHGNLRTDGHSSFVHNRPNLEVTERSLRRGMETQTVDHSDNRCYPALKTYQPPSHEHAWRNFKCIRLSERLKKIFLKDVYPDNPCLFFKKRI